MTNTNSLFFDLNKDWLVIKYEYSVKELLFNVYNI